MGWVFFTLALLGIAQVYMIFAIQDLKRQQGHLQERHRELVERAGRLEQENSALIKTDAFIQHARQNLGMEEGK